MAALADLTSIRVLSSAKQVRNEAFRLVALALSCCAIFYGEYRLTVNGLLFSIPAALCAGISKALHRIHHESVYHTIATSNEATFYSFAFAISIVWAFFEESTLNVISALHMGLVLNLVLNVVSGAVVIVLGRSWLLSSKSDSSDQILDSRIVPTLSDITACLSLAGLVGYVSVVMMRRSYTSLLQFVAFFTAVLCLDNGRLFGLTDWFKRCSLGHYTLVESSREADVINESEHRSRVKGRDGKYRMRYLMQRLLVVSPIYPIVSFLVVGIWMAFAKENFTIHSVMPHSMQPSLDLTYTPSAEVEIVISSYHEPLDSVRDLIASLKSIPSLTSALVRIYTKNEEANLDAIQQQTRANNVTRLTNVGREGETYLHHIVHEWDSLAKHTLFIQGDVHNHREFFPRVRDYYDPEKTGMLSLGFSGNVCNCQLCGDRWGWSDSIVYKIYKKVYPRGICSKVLLSYKGQFIVSARRIRGVSKIVYEELLDALVMENSWAHREEYLKGRKDSLNAPFFGFTLERLWNVLFQCSNLDVAWRCPSLLSGTRSGGNKGDCQCFDHVR